MPTIFPVIAKTIIPTYWKGKFHCKYFMKLKKEVKDGV